MIEKDRFYSVNEIIEMGLISVKHKLPDLPEGVKKDIQQQMLRRDIRTGKLLATKLSNKQYVVRGQDLIIYISNYGKSTIITKQS